MSVVLASSLASSFAIPAFADPSLSDKETARSLMEDGDGKRDKNDLRGALKSYEAADAIMKVPTTGLEVARTQAALGMLLEAKESAGRVARSQPKPGEPPPFVAARKAAEQLQTELGTRIPSIAVAFASLEPGQTPTLTFDGESVPPAAANAPRKVNPGTHIIIARVGSVERREEPRVAEKEQRTITIDFKAAPAPPVTPVANNTTPPAPPPSDQVTLVPEKPSGGIGKPLMWGGFVVGAIGIGVGSVTGLMSISKVNDLKPSCPNDKCTPDKQSDLDSAKSLGTVSTIAFIVGGLGVGAGVVGLILSGKESKSETTDARIRPVVGPTYLGLDGTF